MKKILVIICILFFSVVVACPPSMYQQAKENGTVKTYCKSLHTLMMTTDNASVFFDALSSYWQAKCYKLK